MLPYLSNITQGPMPKKASTSLVELPWHASRLLFPFSSEQRGVF